MDALKRAEKARQAEASSDEAELDLASIRGSSLDSAEASGSAEQPLRREPRLDRPGSTADTRSDSRSELSLENTRSVRGRLGIEEDDGGGAASRDAIGGYSPSDSISLIYDADAVDVAHVIPQDTPHTPPSIENARQWADKDFDGTRSASLSRDDPEWAESDEPGAPQQRAAEDTGSQGRARAVFHAKAVSRGRGRHNWGVLVLVALLLLLIVGGSVFVFSDRVTEMLSDWPPVARQVPPTTTRSAGPVIAPVPQTSTGPGRERAVAVNTSPPGVTAPNTPLPAAPSDTRAPVVSSAPPDGGATGTTAAVGAGETTLTPDAARRSASQATMAEVAKQAPTVAQAINPMDTDSGQRLSAEEQVERAIQRAGLAPASPSDGAAFTIKRQSIPDKMHPRLSRAYDAWRSGDLRAARRDYDLVLKSEPRNRDALLGLGAVAVRDGRWEDASARYTTLLRLNPKDSIAQAGLIAVHENVDPVRGESQIKLLLREEPNAAHLHFTLGNMYAAQNRWGEAQSAYFDAYRLQAENPDYAYNVAVSLDELGKAAAAVGYYRRALELAAENGAVFDRPSVRRRLLKLAFQGAAP